MGRVKNFVPKITKEEFERTSPYYCNCPDHEIIEWKEHYKYYGIPKYIYGHSMKGRLLSKEWRYNLSISHKEQVPYMKGKHHTKGTHEKMILSHKNQDTRGNHNNFFGKKHTEESCKKMSISHIGLQTKENHPNWKGGITSLSAQIRGCLYYQQWRSSIFKRDNYTCVMCGGKGYLEVHHHKISFSDIMKEYNIDTFNKSMNCKELWDINNGVTLCLECHNKTKGHVSITTYKYNLLN